MDFEKRYDIVIAGAGIAGIAAALEAARSGYQTALVEKTVLVGGLATAGLINVYLPLCDGHGHQVIHGLSEELLHLSYRYGPGQVPRYWRDGTGDPRQRYRVRFSPASFVLALDQALEQAGVALWLDTLVTEPVCQGPRLIGIAVENKSGRGVLYGKCFIDATGDADVAYRAGAPCVETDNWLSLWALGTSLANAQGVVEDPENGSLLERLTLGSGSTGRGQPPDQPKRHGTDGRQVTAFILQGRRLLREHYADVQRRGGVHARQHAFPLTLPSMAQFRTTRRIQGQETLSDGQDFQHRETSVGLTPDWRKPGPIWEIPYGALLPEGVTRLLLAGRCISSAGDAWEVTRVIPPAALTGQVAGVAAGLSLTHDTTPDHLEIPMLQAALRERGFPLHIGDLDLE